MSCAAFALTVKSLRQARKGFLVAPKLRLFGLVAVVVLALTAATSGGTAEAALSCSGQTYVRPFVPWLDDGNYVSVPSGSLEGSTGWQLSNGAKLVSGNEPWRVNRSTDSRSLSLPSGSAATSPALCITLLHPTLRFFARNSGAATTTLRVEAITSVLGTKATLPIGVLTAGSWQPTPTLLLLDNLLSPITGTVQFRFTPVGSNSGWQIDDVYVDPYKQR
jgi:hypothetical protein